jgi:trans-2,3-dihydro-3-hydroxyanthranilate isomerase
LCHQSKKALEAVQIDKKKQPMAKCQCKTQHKALYFFEFRKRVHTRMLCIEHNQIVEDAATGSASRILQPIVEILYETINLINHQGDSVGRPSQIYFDGNVLDNNYMILRLVVKYSL